MRRVSIIAIVPIAVLLVCAVWAIPGSAADDTKDKDKAPAAAPSPAQAQLDEAVARFKERDFDGALKSLKKAVEKDPNLPPANVIMAEFFARANVGTAARSYLERAVVDAPNDPQAYLVLGDIARRDGRIIEARLLFEKADLLMAKFTNAKRKVILQPQVLAGLTLTSEAREDWVDAQRQAEAWLRLDPKSTMALRQLGFCLLKQKDVQGALEDLVKACNIDPELPSPEATVAEFYARANDQPNAKKWMISALTAKPKDIETRLLAAQWAFETAQLADAEKQAAAAMRLVGDEKLTVAAIKDAEKQTAAAARLDSQSMRAMILRGLTALFQKNFKAAEEYFQSAHLLKPNDFAASNNLALALVEQNDEEKKQRALEYAETNAQRYGKSNQASEAFSTYGWVLYKLGRLDDAERAFRAAISGGSFSADTAYYFARLLAKRGHDKEAKQLLDSALQSTTPFANREDAKRLLEEVKK